MREAILPFKWRHEDAFGRLDCIVRKPDGWRERRRLSRGPGFWTDHLVFGRLRIVGVLVRREGAP